MRVLITETTFPAMTMAGDLARMGLLVTRADDAEDALTFVAHAAQDVVIVEADLPDRRPVDLIRTLRRQHPTLGIILIAPAADLAARLTAFEAGADDALPHGTPASEVGARIDAIARRYRGRAQAELRLGDLTLDLATRKAHVGANELPLARLEFSLLEFLAQRTGQVQSRDAIMAHLYGLDDSPDSRIITAYVCHIRSKIEAAGGDGSILCNHWGRGYSVQVPATAADRMPLVALDDAEADALVARLAA
jgi:DNA-binding response OmpR family regulator